MKPPQFLHHGTWPAGRRPPHAGLRPEQEEGGGETERDRGSRTGPCRRDSPASGSAPRPAPGPKPTLPHPPRTERERRCGAAPAGWGGEHRARGADKGAREAGLGVRESRSPAFGCLVLSDPNPLPRRAVLGWVSQTPSGAGCSAAPPSGSLEVAPTREPSAP